MWAWKASAALAAASGSTCPAPPARHPPPGPAEAESESAPSEQSSTLLYIEDDLLSQRLLATVLSRKRPLYRLLTAGTGSAGLALAREHAPDLILLDQHLPDGTGFDFFRTLQSQPETRAIPVIALSGNADPEEIRATLDAGYTDYLIKPLQIDAALSTLDKWLDKRL